MFTTVFFAILSLTKTLCGAVVMTAVTTAVATVTCKAIEEAMGS